MCKRMPTSRDDLLVRLFLLNDAPEVQATQSPTTQSPTTTLRSKVEKIKVALSFVEGDLLILDAINNYLEAVPEDGSVAAAILRGVVRDITRKDLRALEETLDVKG